MNAYRLAIRSRDPDSTCFIDLAISKPPLYYEPLLTDHSLVPFNGGVAAIGEFESSEAAKQAQDDLVLLIQAIESTGLNIAKDQSLINRDRRISKLLTKPIALEDERGEIVILDLRKGPEPGVYVLTWVANDPLAMLGWSVGAVDMPELASGYSYRLSSPTVDVWPIQDRTEEFLL